MLFLIPIGGGIPAGVLLAKQRGIGWPVMEVLYLLSDVILAMVFEPVLLLLVALGRRIPALARFLFLMREAIKRSASQYGMGAGPFTLIAIAFGVDPMTGRSAAAFAGHGFFSGWALAITGDMLYFTVIMLATLKLGSIIRDPNMTMGIILSAMFLLPLLVRRAKQAFRHRFRRL